MPARVLLAVCLQTTPFVQLAAAPLRVGKTHRLPARADAETQDVNVDADDDVLGQQRHQGEDGGVAEERAPLRREHVRASSLEDADDAVGGAQGEERRGEDEPLRDLGGPGGKKSEG